MNRLTERNKLGIAISNVCKNCEHDFSCTEYDTGKIIDKLAAYEDLEEQGLLIKLPCNVGDIFFINVQKKTYECKISGFYIDKDEIQFMVAFQDEDNKTWFEIGETHRQDELFATKEEAEKALEVQDAKA